MRKVPIIVVSILFLSLLCPSAFADWQVTFDMGADTEVGNSVRQTRDGGYIVAGSLWGITPGGQVVLIKTDANGAEEWTKGFEMSHGPCVQQTRDDGYAIAGSTISVGAVSSDLYVVKTDADGNEQGSNSFGGPEHDYGQYIEETSDGGYIITGSTRSYGAGSKDVWLIKTDADYGEQWNRTFGGSDDDEGFCVRQTLDGGYIIVGKTASFRAGGTDVWLIKTDSFGIKQWDKTFSWTSRDYGNCVQQTADGGYIVGGTISGEQMVLIKTEAEGNEEWSRTFSGANEATGSAVQQTVDGGFIISGTTRYEDCETDALLVKTDPLGNLEWSKTLGDGNRNHALWGQQTDDGAYIS